MCLLIMVWLFQLLASERFSILPSASQEMMMLAAGFSQSGREKKIKNGSDGMEIKVPEDEWILFLFWRQFCPSPTIMIIMNKKTIRAGNDDANKKAFSQTICFFFSTRIPLQSLHQLILWPSYASESDRHDHDDDDCFPHPHLQWSGISLWIMIS